MTVNVTDVDETRPPVIVTPAFAGGGGGGGGPSGPTPSDEDFEWNVTRDLEELDSSNDWPTGAWSDGAILWLAENGPGADDAVYAYDIETGERVEEREFALAEANRSPQGFWSDRTTALGRRQGPGPPLCLRPQERGARRGARDRTRR